MDALGFYGLDVNPSLRNLTSNFGKIPETPNDFLQALGAPHVDSFNYILRGGLNRAVEDVLPAEFLLQNKDRICLKIESAKLHPALVASGTYGTKTPFILPSECRQRGITYKGRLVIQISCKVNDIQIGLVDKDMGQIPIIVKSDICHISKLKPAQLIAKGEHAEEWGGYFIIKGHERLVRMLQMTRRNYPIVLSRAGWKQHGVMFSELGVLIRCVKDDESAMNNVLHFVKDGSAKLMFSYKKNIYYAPVILILKCLLDVSDEYMLHQIMGGYEEDTYFKGCLMNMIRAVHEEGIHTHTDAKAYVGKTFRSKLYELPSWKTDIEICDFIIQRCLAIHLNDREDKFNLYVLMIQKLFYAVQKKCCLESADGIMMHELLLGGHLYLQVIKERLQSWLQVMKIVILKKDGSKVDYKLTPSELNWALKKCGSIDVGIESFLATGNIYSTNLSLLQTKGLTIVAENINRMRYMSHFRAVHRGAFFQEMRSSEPRQLLPDAWGFICPVHTPDGTPCGLLNHLTKYCEVTTKPDPELVSNIPTVLVSLGMMPLKGLRTIVLNHKEQFVVLLDGRVLGHVERTEAPRLVDKLRMLKIIGKKVPNTLEIVLVPMGRKCGQFPGLFLFTGPTRMMRPVINLAAKKIELIGTFEQVYMDICIYPEEAYKGLTTHQEVSDTSFLSSLACLIPMPDCNQSPRNMYQCQMGKQTMGTACHNWHLQAETKLYRLLTPASPFFRPGHYDLIGLDDFAMGTNAVVAVVSYTGYDMEDAMIINKSSYERGFAHGCVYKSEFVLLPSQGSYFGLDPEKPNLCDCLDSDGLPHPGALIKQGQPYCCYYDNDQTKFQIERWKNKEDAYVDNVRLCGGLTIQELPKACIVFRIPRNPSVGDKFASRAGQKGICSYLWPAEDLPCTETGLIPDIVFNPHGFPSRMTIAMMIEVMAGKSAALHGLVHDATPFRFSEKDTAIDYFGRMLEAGGYNYYSTEKMYSGIDGHEMNADIFFGIVHYQRLRHMVSDKWQVRSTGPVDVLTHQPVKGRRRGGGVRFGEMERDSLLSHGAALLLQDRLFHCSDKTTMYICRTCGSILSPIIMAIKRGDHYERMLRCQVCREKGLVEEVEMPYVFRYLVAQLASVNINVKLNVVEK